jgi:hypothetical protein
MNVKRVLLGGLLAGLFIDIAEGALSNLVIGDQFKQEIARLGLGTNASAAAILFFVSWGFVVGLVSVFLYASIRPRFGPGVMTALIAATLIWVVHGLLPHLKDGFLGIFSMNLSLKFAAMQLVWQIAATLIGARVYQER